MTKYQPLTTHLAARGEPRIAMSFSEMERVLGFSLPRSAREYRPWWANSAHGHVQSRAWLDAGYQSEDVDLAAERLVFARLNAVEPAPRPKGRHPLIGCMKGTIVILPGTDLTEPTAPDWPDMTVEKFDRLMGQAP